MGKGKINLNKETEPFWRKACAIIKEDKIIKKDRWSEPDNEIKKIIEESGILSIFESRDPKIRIRASDVRSTLLTKEEEPLEDYIHQLFGGNVTIQSTTEGRRAFTLKEALVKTRSVVAMQEAFLKPEPGERDR